MTDHASNKLEQLFKNLDRWRHLPNYQLERRADVLFSLYLPELVAKRVGRPVLETMVPELPILCSLVWPERLGMQSVKADYLLVATDRTEAYLVELKTDASSRRDVQDEYLREACGCGLTKVLESLIQIAKASQSRAKYASLFRLLAELGLIRCPASTSPIDARWFDGATVLDCPPVLEPIYVQPHCTNEAETVIDFSTIAAHASTLDDDLSRLFASHLPGWARTAGGD